MIRENADTSADGGAHVEVPPDRDAMVGLMRRYRRARQEREEAEANGAAYVAQVREEIKQDIAPMKEHEERLRGAMLVFVREHNGGGSFRVPGLGCAYLSTRRTVSIDDEKAFVERYTEAFGRESLERLYHPPKLNLALAKKEATRIIEEDGEILGGVGRTKSVSLSVKFRSTGGAE